MIIRRFAQVRMAPAVCLGALLAAGFAAARAPGLAVTATEMLLLFGFGALNLGLGLALFVTGARLVPAAVAALLGVAEPLLGPAWVWLFMGEVPGPRALIGGGLVLAALVAHLAWQLAGSRCVPSGFALGNRPTRVGRTGARDHAREASTCRHRCARAPPPRARGLAVLGAAFPSR